MGEIPGRQFPVASRVFRRAAALCGIDGFGNAVGDAVTVAGP